MKQNSAALIVAQGCAIRARPAQWAKSLSFSKQWRPSLCRCSNGAKAALKLSAWAYCVRARKSLRKNRLQQIDETEATIVFEKLSAQDVRAVEAEFN